VAARRGDRPASWQPGRGRIQGLLEALRLVEPLDLAIPFLVEEQGLDLLHAGRGRNGRHESFVQQRSARPTSPSHGGEHGLDRLTTGELAVLRELPSRLTQKEIAAPAPSR
jgi:hypothetical protein